MLRLTDFVTQSTQLFHSRNIFELMDQEREDLDSVLSETGPFPQGLSEQLLNERGNEPGETTKEVSNVFGKSNTQAPEI